MKRRITGENVSQLKKNTSIWKYPTNIGDDIQDKFNQKGEFIQFNLDHNVGGDWETTKQMSDQDSYTISGRRKITRRELTSGFYWYEEQEYDDGGSGSHA
jgi:hypothetical protein